MKAAVTLRRDEPGGDRFTASERDGTFVACLLQKLPGIL